MDLCHPVRIYGGQKYGQHSTMAAGSKRQAPWLRAANAKQQKII